MIFRSKDIIKTTISNWFWDVYDILCAVILLVFILALPISCLYLFGYVWWNTFQLFTTTIAKILFLCANACISYTCYNKINDIIYDIKN